MTATPHTSIGSGRSTPTRMAPSSLSPPTSTPSRSGGSTSSSGSVAPRSARKCERRLPPWTVSFTPDVAPLHQSGDDRDREETALGQEQDRKSTRLNSSHRCISYAVFCLKKKKQRHTHTST